MSGVNKGKLNQNLPLPSGWEIARDETGKIFYVDHISRKTQWFDPRDKLTKPLTVADCIGDELPFGWEAAFAPGVGVYYIDHIRRKNQLEDPRVEWRNLQINMLNSYLQQAEGGSATDLATNVAEMDPTPTDLIDVDDAIMRSVANVNEPIYEQTRPQVQQQVQQMPIRSPLMDQSSGSSTFLDRVTHLETNDPSLQSSLPVGQMTSAARQMNKEALEKSLVDARARVERLKRDLDANFNLLSIIDKYYKKGNNSFAVEV